MIQRKRKWFSPNTPEKTDYTAATYHLIRVPNKSSGRPLHLLTNNEHEKWHKI